MCALPGGPMLFDTAHKAEAAKLKQIVGIWRLNAYHQLLDKAQAKFADAYQLDPSLSRTE